MSKKKNVTFIRSTAIVYFGIILFVFLFIVLSLFRFKGDEKLVYWTDTYPGEWERIYDDGHRETVELNKIHNIKKGDTLIVESVLPKQIAEGTIIAMFNCRDLEVYIDGELRGLFSNEGNPFSGANVKSIMFQTALESRDAGKCIRYVKHENEGGKFEIAGVYYGDSYGIFKAVFKRYGPNLVLATILFGISVIVAIMSLFLRNKYDEWKLFLAIGVGFGSVTAWTVADNALMQYLFGIYYIDGVWAYMFSMLIPCPFLYYINVHQKRRYESFYCWLALIAVINFVVNTALHFFEIMDYQETRLYMNLVIALVVVFTFVTLIIDAIRGYAKEYKYMFIGMMGFAVGGIMEVLTINVVNNPLSGSYLLISLYFLMIMTMLQLMLQIRANREAAFDAIKANKLKSEFLANMSHEIRTPINAIMGMNEMILRENTDEQILEYAGNIKNASHNLLNIVNDILDLSKIEAGKMETIENEYELFSVIDDVAVMLGVKANDKQLKLNVSVDSSLPKILYGDDGKIRQILINLLNNSVKYTKEGSINFDVKGIRSETGLCLEFHVRDTGIGIKEEDIDKLFDKFIRVDQKKNNGIEGTGLGLSITAGMVNILGGKIDVKSQYGVGTEFIVTLPQKVVDETPIGDYNAHHMNRSPVKKVEVRSFVAPDAKVIVVDDNFINLKVFKGLLKNTLMNVEMVESGEALLEAVNNNSYDIIFLDHMMPGMDGMETLKLLQERGNTIPVVALTANAIKDAKEMYLAAGFADYLSKPIIIDELNKVLLKYLPEKLINYTE